MKKTYLLLLICCISTINIFGAENKKNEKLARQPIDYWTYINEIDQLKEKHAQEIAIYEKKIEALMAHREQQNNKFDESVMNLKRAD
jgi:hypothetical protein